MTGKLGEAIFVRDIMNFCGNPVPFFDPIFLGEKAECVDYIIKLIGVDGASPFFFVQVKTTRLGYATSKSGPRLRVKVAPKSVSRMKEFPAPRYVVGVDEEGARSYLVAILDGAKGGISTLSTSHPLNADNLRKLWLEVQEYWSQRDMRMSESVFADGRRRA